MCTWARTADQVAGRAADRDPGALTSVGRWWPFFTQRRPGRRHGTRRRHQPTHRVTKHRGRPDGTVRGTGTPAPRRSRKRRRGAGWPAGTIQLLATAPEGRPEPLTLGGCSPCRWPVARRLSDRAGPPTSCDQPPSFRVTIRHQRAQSYRQNWLGLAEAHGESPPRAERHGHPCWSFPVTRRPVVPRGHPAGHGAPGQRGIGCNLAR